MKSLVERFFAQQVPGRLTECPHLFALGRTLGLEIDGVGAWTLRLTAPATCTPGLDRDDPELECWVGMDEHALMKVLGDPTVLRALFARRQVRVGGDMAMALHARELFSLLGVPQRPSGLEQFFPDCTAETFCQHWPDELRLAHGSLERTPEVAELCRSGLGSVHDLLARWPRQVRLADRHWAQEVDVRTAAEKAQQGFHLAFSEVEQVFPVLRATLAHLRWQLDLPINCYGRCLSYASPAGTGEDLHFDHNANFVIQLQGCKLWRVAPNRHIQAPTDRYTVANPIVSEELKRAGVTELPTQLPQEGAQDILLQPGSILYVPRGYWHQTIAESDSLSLNFTFDQPAWLDLLPHPTRSGVLPLVGWRELASGAGSARKSQAQRAARHLSGLLATAPQSLRHLHADDLIAQLRPTEAAVSPLDRHLESPA